MGKKNLAQLARFPYGIEAWITYPPFWVMLVTTASAPGASISPITTLELVRGSIVGHHLMDCVTYPYFAKAKATSLPIPFAPPKQCSHFSLLD